MLYQQQPSASSSSSQQSSSIEDISVQVQKAIKSLPTLHEKAQAIAINSYLETKKQLDKEQEQELDAVDMKYRSQMDYYISRIQEIVEGRMLESQDLEGVAASLLSEQQQTHIAEHSAKTNPIKDYWLKCLKSGHATTLQIHQNDQPVLSHLTKLQSGKDGSKLWLRFHFSENQWFKNPTLVKQFQVQDDQILSTSGDKIDWKQGKNLTVRIVKNKKKNKKNEKKVTTKEVKEESFFHMFTAIDLKENQEDEMVELAELQYSIAEEIHEDVIPHSIEFYLGIGMVGGEIVEEEAGVEDIEEEKTRGKKKKNKHKEHSKQKERSGSERSKSKEEKKKGEAVAAGTTAEGKPKSKDKTAAPQNKTNQQNKEQCKQQ